MCPPPCTVAPSTHSTLTPLPISSLLLLLPLYFVACPQNALEFFRLRLKGSREILAAPGNNSLVIVVQVWRTQSEVAAAQAAAEAEAKAAEGKN